MLVYPISFCVLQVLKTALSEQKRSTTLAFRQYLTQKISTIADQEDRYGRDRGATLRLGEGGGGHISDSILGSTRHFFILTFKILKILGGGGEEHAPGPPAPRFLHGHARE